MTRLKMNLMILGMAMLLLSLVGDGLAQVRNLPGKRNGGYAQKSLRQGIRSGRISGEEAQIIRQNQRSLRQERRGYLSDGVCQMRNAAIYVTIGGQ